MAAITSDIMELCPQDLHLEEGLQTPANGYSDVETDTKYKTYKRRWCILFAYCLLSCAKTMSWIGFAPVANFVDEYYEHKGASSLLSLVFLGLNIPLGMIAMWCIGRFGLRSTMHFGAFCNGIGSVIRLMSSMPGHHRFDRFSCAILGQIFTAIADPSIMYIPSQIAVTWFPPNQRALATALASVASIFGMLVVNIVVPYLVQNTADVFWLNVFTFLPAVTACIFVTVTVRWSKPKSPPSASATKDKLGCIHSVKKIWRSKNFYFLLISTNCTIAMFYYFMSTMEQMLCPKGYSENFAATLCCISIAGGLIGPAIVGAIVDKTKLFEEAIKISNSLGTVGAIVFLVLALQQHMEVYLAICCFICGVFGMSCVTIGQELAAESTFPVPATVSAGFIQMLGKTMGAVFIAISASLSTELSPSEKRSEVCTSKNEDPGAEVYPQSKRVPHMFLCVLMAVGALVFIAIFKPNYRRVQLEAQKESYEMAGYENPNYNCASCEVQPSAIGNIEIEEAAMSETQIQQNKENIFSICRRRM